MSKTPRLIMEKAEWAKFYNLIYIATPFGVIEAINANELVDQFNDPIMQADLASMPISSDRVMPRLASWWTQEYILSNNERKQAKRRYQRTRLVANIITYNRTRARAILTNNKTRKESWKPFVSTLTEDTPMTIVWSRVQRMTEKYKQIVSPSLKYNR